MFTPASVVVTSEQERPCLEEVNQNTTFLSIFTNLHSANNVETSNDDVSAEETSQEMYRQQRTLYDFNLIWCNLLQTNTCNFKL